MAKPYAMDFPRIHKDQGGRETGRLKNPGQDDPCAPRDFTENQGDAVADDAAQVAAAYFQAWRTKDFATLRSLLADREFSYTGPLARLDDADVCRDSLARMAPVTTDLVIRQTFVVGDEVMTWLDLHTTLAEPTAVANWMRVANGRITDIRAVYDPRALLASAELPPGARGDQGIVDRKKGKRTVTTARERAEKPEDLARIWVELANAGDAEGLAELYESDAVMAFPIGNTIVGREAIRQAFEEMLKKQSHYEMEESLPTLRHGDLALTATIPADHSTGRYQVARRQPDGTWLRILHSSGYFA
jgi:uncharacterized protein (TIGR02246 family)